MPEQPYSQHPYQYGLSDPVLYTDPTGQVAAVDPPDTAAIYCGPDKVWDDELGQCRSYSFRDFIHAGTAGGAGSATGTCGCTERDPADDRESFPMPEPWPGVLIQPMPEPWPGVLIQPIPQPEPGVLIQPIPQPEPGVLIQPVHQPKPEIYITSDGKVKVCIPGGGGGGGSGGNEGALDGAWTPKVSTGARHGNFRNLADRWNRYAPQAYASIRQTSRDVAEIARNTGLSKEGIRMIKEHIFYNKHQLDRGVDYFDPDPDIADAWDRLRKGDYIQEDIDFLAHEAYEAEFERIYDTNYRTAHNAAIQAGYTWDPPDVP